MAAMRDAGKRRRQLIARLQLACTRRQAQLDVLQQANARLLCRHQLLLALCCALRELQQHIAADDPQQAPAWHEQEQELLQQLAAEQVAAPDVAAAGGAVAAATADGAPPIAPPHDPLWLLRHSMCTAPPRGGGGCINTVPQLLAHYAATVREVSLALQKACDGGGADSSSDSKQQQQQQYWLGRMQHAFLQHFQQLSAIAQQQRIDLLGALLLGNAETGEVLAQPDMAAHVAAVQQLALSMQQRARIAAGMEVLGQMLARVQQQLQAEARTDSGDVRQRAAQVVRMTLATRKEQLLRACVAAFVFGALSWQQLGRLTVHIYPLSPQAMVVGQLVAEQAAEELSDVVHSSDGA